MKNKSARESKLKSALRQNALFSAVSGILFLIAPQQVSEFLGTGPVWLFIVLGIGLLGFSADLFHQVSRPRLSSMRALVSSLADFVWVLASLLLLVFYYDQITLAGGIAIALVAAIVLQFGLRQVAGINKLFQASEAPGKSVYRAEFSTRAAPEDIWRVIADLSSISNYARNLASSRIKGDVTHGRGSVRECVDHSGRSWTEVCTEFMEGSYLLLEFDADTPNFPFPLSEMTGGWRVTPGSTGSTVEVWWMMVTKPRWAAFFILPLMIRQLEKTLPGLMGNMEAAALSHSDEVAA